MSFNTHVRCDRCEKVLLADNEDELLAEGWLILTRWTGEDEDPSEALDFCSESCIAAWAADRVKEKTGG